MLFTCSRFNYISLNILFILIAWTAMIQPVHSDEGAPVFSYGAGHYEMIIFTDYFCPPCQKMEKELDKTIDEMIGRGGVRVTFVDLPIYKLTPLYAKYFLYAANAAPTYKEALRARQVLFEKAYRLGAITDEHLETALQEANIPIKPYDTRPSLSEYNDIIKKYKVHSTPTFVFIYSPTDIRKYSGSEPIRKGMAEFLRAGAAVKKINDR